MLTNLFTAGFKTIFPLFLVLLASFTHLSSQDLQIDSLGFETFKIEEGDTLFIMK